MLESGKAFYVYRVYDAAGQLLYAGKTQDLVRRFNLHTLRALDLPGRVDHGRAVRHQG